MLKDHFSRRLFLRAERSALRAARILIANSERTRRDLIEHLNIEAKRVHKIYLGSDSDFRPPTKGMRAAARAWLTQKPEMPLVVFVGAMGHESRKGFDVLFSAWRKLCERPEWDADLVVAGGGRAVDFWRRRIDSAGLNRGVRMLGFTDRIPELLAAADLLVSPVRYEAYGLNVHEAICCGVPAMVTRTAGVAERYPAELRPLLIDDPEDFDALATMLLRWRMANDYWREKIVPFSQSLRAYTMHDMARDMVRLCTEEARAGQSGPRPMK
jgi:glycosyltransferase involved in cell wall biosynthesis